jgi:hypothetical protein
MEYGDGREGGETSCKGYGCSARPQGWEPRGLWEGKMGRWGRGLENGHWGRGLEKNGLLGPWGIEFEGASRKGCNTSRGAVK